MVVLCACVCWGEGGKRVSSDKNIKVLKKKAVGVREQDANGGIIDAG